ncbi:urease accessory protein UreH [Thalassobacillus pellis]|uniref:urease accessory protein UreH n=1 Tax=Thalassobacillus pellis TaxID=748008 RepID=UPI0019616F2C|nr:urease accessory protein UreH [Thalassobacillus pellis]MBM7554478.1 sulfite exporter TauE/SafE [Thalassobacillus pellis]
MENLFAILGLGFFLGIKHALEPDHVVAVSTIVGKNKSPWRSSFLGVFWGIGHTLTLLIIFLLLYFTKTSIPGTWEMSFELGVGIMLVYLGTSPFFPKKKNGRRNRKAITSNLFIKSMVIGQIHGLAGSAAMTLLVVSVVDSLKDSLIYIGTFGIGTVVGMLLFTFVLSFPFFFIVNKHQVNTLLIRGTAILSICYGIYYIYMVGFVEGLFT